ncbi:Prefoldin [Colletotrichum higginsianum IMI 349063]|uniref:Prefoldin n=1 Tax=Colletotrichum higginsianum (strain IMI 349063) TaxID=759273 RepID=A0A1B7YV82_COLHI|nr:Prefoldin [Colletotrichum higginsianum IMI 349063]OBR15955.1 Prefoldin [Colletotrichum higginsianum IMI 349063]
MAAQGSESINLETLDAQQLSQVKKQLEEELEHLTNSFAQLHSAQAKFKECLRCVKARPGSQEEEKSVLVPLTNSLYVRGELSDPKHVIVDVGTGFYVEKAGLTFMCFAPGFQSSFGM